MHLMMKSPDVDIEVPGILEVEDVNCVDQRLIVIFTMHGRILVIVYY
jgi:hypothetical protein